MQSDFKRFDVLGIPICATTLETATEALILWSSDNQGRYVGVREVPSLMAMRATPRLISVAKGAAMNVPDGMPLVWLGRALGLKIERTYGPDLMEKVLLEAPKNGLKHFLYGGKEGVADKVAALFRERVKGIQIVGTYCPPFRSQTEAEMDEIAGIIKTSGADVVWVGMSSPKQDEWMAKMVHRVPVTMVGVGAAFDFHAGTVRQAPKWLRNNGLEWLFRLIKEPRRLWYRYLVLAPQFVVGIIRQPPRKL
jgi:N-acetylglucosaminyldiphosphoundecaprenol N-acetyl-beta-D-mannosaminyltransferase